MKISPNIRTKLENIIEFGKQELITYKELRHCPSLYPALKYIQFNNNRLFRKIWKDLGKEEGSFSHCEGQLHSKKYIADYSTRETKNFINFDKVREILEVTKNTV